jgi:hypothetical protein
VIVPLQEGVATLGGSSCVKTFTQTSQFEQCSNSKHQVLFGSHILSLFPSAVTVPSSVIIYNLEQVGKTRWMKPAMISLLQQHKVWDYSLKNIEVLNKHEIRAQHMPVSYTNSLQRIPSREQDIDALLVGTCNRRRCSIIKALRKHGVIAFLAGAADRSCADCMAYILPPVYGSERDELLSRARIHLNIHYFEVGVFEVVRVSHLLANSLFVISEVGKGLEDPEENYFSSGVIFSKYPKIVGKVVQFLRSSNNRNKIANIGFNLMSRRSITPYLRCQLFAKETSFPGINLFTEKSHTNVLASPYSIDHMTAFAEEFPVPPCFRILAVMAGFNEEDILASSITDLIEQGVDVHYVDNWSTDRTFQLIQQLQDRYPGRIEYEKWPAVKTSDTFDLGNLLQHTSEVSRQSPCDWAIHLDADELRESPWGHAVSLRKAIYIADQMGYNLVNFGNVLIFPPVRETNFTSSQNNNLRKTFKYFVNNKFRMNGIQIKSWKTYHNTCEQKAVFSKSVIMNLASTGGHIARYVDSSETQYVKENLFPYNFFLRHYPIRSQQHGLRKVFRERKSRWNETERGENWHKQYEDVKNPKFNFVEDSKRLWSILDDGSLPPHMYARTLPCLPYRGVNTISS